MPVRDDLPEGVAVCECCGELYTDELTLSEMCEICDFYEYEDDTPTNLMGQSRSVGGTFTPK